MTRFRSIVRPLTWLSPRGIVRPSEPGESGRRAGKAGSCRCGMMRPNSRPSERISRGLSVLPCCRSYVFWIAHWLLSKMYQALAWGSGLGKPGEQCVATTRGRSLGNIAGRRRWRPRVCCAELGLQGWMKIDSRGLFTELDIPADPYMPFPSHVAPLIFPHTLSSPCPPKLSSRAP